MGESTLKISGIGFPPFSCREAEQILMPVKTGDLRRTVNGELCYIGTPLQHKYKSIIVCQDERGPALHHLWVGAAVTVECLMEIWQEGCPQGDTETLTVSRPLVAGSVQVVDLDGAPCAFKQQTPRTLLIPGKGGQRVHIAGRPILEMRVVNFQATHTEWIQKTRWRLELEEI